MTEDEMVGWHHCLDGHEFEEALGNSERQGSLVCCSPWGHKELDTTERLNSNNILGRASQMGLVVKNQPANARDVRDVGLIPGSGRAP